MTIAATGPLRTTAIRAEYGGGTPMRLGAYRRGNAAGWVKANGSGNVATNLSAGVGTTVLRMSQFRGQAKGFLYTNTTTRISSGGNHYHCHSEFGTDWATTTWPCFYTNNAVLGSTDTGTYALVIYGRSTGPFTFTNNNEIQGAGGQPNSGAGQHAVYIYNSIAGANRPIIINNWGIRGGGGAGGIGGTGGQGGPGAYNYTAEERPAYSGSFRVLRTASHVVTGGQGGGQHNEPGGEAWYWGGQIAGSGENTTAISIGGFTYYRGGQVFSSGWDSGYYIFRQWTATAGSSGGGGGGGGNGGRGIGYNSPNQGGLGGAGGGAPGPNAGWGGTGGAGGTGGSWGENGYDGGIGYTGQGGNAGGGAGGTGGGGGGAAGYCVYAASPWGFVNNNTINGPYGGGAAPS